MSDEGSSRLARRASIIAAGTLASRLLGALRDAVIAATFPLLVTDVFWLAFVIPNSLRMILAEGAMSGAFVPVFTQVNETEGKDAAKHFAAKFAGTMLVILTLVALTGVLFAPGWVMAFASGYESRPEVYADTIHTTRVVFPYIVLMGIAAIMTGALQARRSFAAGAFAPAMLNVAFVLVPVTLLPLGNHLGWSGTTILAVAALVGGTFHVLALIPALARVDLVVRPRISFGDPIVRRALRLLVPMLAGLGVYQLNVAISRQFLSHLPDGSMSYLYYAQRLVEIPQGMFALAVGSAALPAIATTVARGDTEGGRRILNDALRLTLFVAIPSSVALAVLASPIVSALFGHGRFGAEAVQQTARSLVFQSFGIAAVSAVRTIVPMFHGMRDTKTPVIASAANLICFASSAALLVPTMGHTAVALALTLASLAQLLVLLVLLRMRTGSGGASELLGAVFKTGVASCVAGAAMHASVLAGRATFVGDTAGAVVKLLALVVYGTVGAIAFFGAAYVLKVDEVAKLRDAIRRKLG